MILRHSFRQGEIEQQRIGEAKTGREEKRYVNTPTAQYSSNSWSKNESQAKRRADQPHTLGPFFFGGDVCNISLRGRNVTACDAVENSAGKEHPQSVCRTQYEEADARSDY